MVGMVGNGENRPVPVIPGLAVKVSDAAELAVPVRQSVLPRTSISGRPPFLCNQVPIVFGVNGHYKSASDSDIQY